LTQVNVLDKNLSIVISQQQGGADEKSRNSAVLCQKKTARCGCPNRLRPRYAVVAHITLKPGQALKAHSTPVDVCFFVLEGEGICQIGDEEVSVGEKTLLWNLQQMLCMHGVTKPITFFVFLVVKAPKLKSN
jgi:hypothetical protein